MSLSLDFKMNEEKDFVLFTAAFSLSRIVPGT